MKILICDDEIEIVNAVEKYLKGRGCNVGCALDGKKGLELIKSGNYGLVFLDVNMPELNGIEVLKYVRDNNIKTKVVFLTGYPCITEHFTKGLQVDGYLQKPVDLKVLGEIVDKYSHSGGEANMKILICDDEIEIVKVLEKYLKSKGCNVGCALDGEKGLALIKSGDYGIVFLDINMPWLTGFDINRYIRDNNIKTKVVFLTGYPCIDEDFAKRIGAAEYLEKPVDLKVIGEIVDKYTHS